MLAAGIKRADEIGACAVPAFASKVGRPLGDGVVRFRILATNQRDRSVLSGAREDGVGGLVIGSDVRLVYVDGVRGALGAAQRRDQPKEPDGPRRRGG